MSVPARLAAVLLVCVLGTSSEPDVAAAVSRAFGHRTYAAAANALDRDFPRFVDDIVALTEIPAPPFGESARAAATLARFRDAGLTSAALDAAGNVVAFRPGRGGPLVVFAAHLDTVFPAGTDVHVRRSGTQLSAPGVGDNAVGVATLVAIARALTAAHAETANDLLFVADVGEEAAGDLRGMRYLLTQGPYRRRVAQFVAIDGAGDGRTITTTAVASVRYRVTFSGPGGHSFGSFGAVNPVNAMANAIAALNRLDVPTSPRTTFNVGVIGGGTAVNAIPASVWMDVDLRSESADELSRLDRRFRAIVDDAAEAENRAHSVQLGAIRASLSQEGSRPAGNTPVSAAIVRTTAAVFSLMNRAPVFGSGSTDANLAMSRGIPAITIDAGVPGDRPHAPDEWIDVDRDAALGGLQRTLLLVLSLGGVI